MKLQDWEKEMLAVTVAYRIAECGDEIPLLLEGSSWEPFEDLLQEMFNRDLIKPDPETSCWALDAGGRDLLRRTCAMVDAGLNFEIFVSYNFDAVIEDAWWNDAGTQVKDNVWDVRFDPNHPGTKEDLRLAMVCWMNEKLRREGHVDRELDPRRVVYVRHLANGLFNEPARSFVSVARLKDGLEEAEAIAQAAYRWQDLHDDPEQAFAIASTLYTAGMLQLRKEEGRSCGACGSPLALFKFSDRCPICKASFEPPEPTHDELECPKCRSLVREHDPRCTGCGARLDLSLPPGTVSTVHRTTVEYGYVPQGWYDPWNPCLNAMAFGVLVAPIFIV